MHNDMQDEIAIRDIERFSEQQLLEKLRHVNMLEDKGVFPYADAYASLETIAIQDLFPAQRYVWRKELDKVRRLKWALEQQGVDIFRLDGFIRMTISGSSEPIDLLPPVVEEVVERNGRVVRVVADGMHRVYLSYLEWVLPQVLYVRGVRRDLPYYAFPIPENDWRYVELIETIPPGYIKKWHRIEKNKTLYRDFNSAFVNVGGPRGHSGK